MNSRRAWGVGILLALIAIALVLQRSDFARQLSFDELRNRAQSLAQDARLHLVYTVLIFFGLYTAISVLAVFPAAIALNLLAGVIFGPSTAAVVVSTASSTAATLVFLGARFFFRDWVQERFRAKLRSVNMAVRKDGAFYLFWMRLTPVVPFSVVNLLMALTPISARSFFATSVLAMLPASWLYAYAGSQISSARDLPQILTWQMALTIALLGALPLLGRVLARKFSQGRART